MECSCGKRRFLSRKDARAFLRESAGRSGLDTTAMRPYACPDISTLWHVGHLPREVRRGRRSAAEVYGT